MIDFLNQYLKEIDRKIKDGKSQDWEEILKNHRETVEFIQHERLIHLLVTLTVAVLFVMSMMFSLIYQFEVLFLVDFLLLVLLVPYIFHYFRLENGVQKMYWIDKLIEEKIKD
ncbi:MAG: hypothetical protein PHN66_02290 [Candidatus Shapirobacteria bacterium]|nr:hypothetical protein [Candidatus Shapirobacteria bacterium]